MKFKACILCVLLFITVFSGIGSADSAISLFNQGNDYLQMKQYSIAIDFFTQAIALAPDKHLFYEYRGHAKHKSGDYNGAIADFDTAFGLCSYCYTILYSRAESKKALGDKAGADADMLQATHLQQTGTDPVLKNLNQRIANVDPQDTFKLGRGCLLRAELKYRRGNWAGALADYDIAIGLLGEFTLDDYYANMAVCKRNLGDIQGAIAVMSEAVQVFPESTFVLRKRADLKTRIGDEAGAITDRQAMDVILKNDNLKSIQMLTDKIGAGSTDWTLYSRRLEYRELVEQWPEALEDIDIILTLLPNSPEDFQRYNKQILDLKDKIETRISYIGKTPHEIYYMKNKGQIDLMTSFIEEDPADHDSYWTRSIHRWGYGDYEGSIEDISAAIELSKSFKQDFQMAYKQQYEQTVSDLKDNATEILDADSLNHLVRWARAKLKWLLKDYEGAIADMEIVVQQQPDNQMYQQTLDDMEALFAAMQP